MNGSQDSPLLAYFLPVLAALVLAAPAFAYDGPDKDKDNKTINTQPAAKKPANPGGAPTPDPETAALAFLRENHPELAELLQRLKPVKPAEYDRAVRELAQVSRNLAAIKARNPQAYERNLNVWKAKSRVELLTAKLASASGPCPELESQLRQAVEDQLDIEIGRQKFERDQVEERFRKLKENLDRLESRRGSIIESRYQALLKKGERARQQNEKAAASKPKPKAQARVKVNTDATNADPAATTTKRDRQP
jgi:hypothetical protein